MKSILSVGIMLLVLGTSSAQKTIKELAQLPDKKLSSMIQTMSYGSEVQLFANNARKQAGMDLPDPVVPQPKKVGLLTFFISDISEVDAKAARRGLTYEKYLTEAATTMLGKDFYQIIYPALESSFQASGMTLLTPDQYLDSSEKKEIYNSYEVELSKVVSMALKTFGLFDLQNNHSMVAAEGYRIFPAPVSTAPQDMKLVRSMGPLAEQLGVDALLSVYIMTSLDGKTVGLKGLRLALHSPNPVPDHPDINYGLGFFYEGILLESCYLDLETPVPFAKLPKKASNFEDMNLDGLSELTSRMTTTMISNIALDYASKGSKKKK